MKAKSQRFSILINTRNRCNGVNSEPFSWAVDSIRMQNLKVPVLVVDDYSDSDHSSKLIAICQSAGFDYYRTKKQEGCNASRRVALNFIETPWHLILDDDSALVKQNALESMESTLLDIERNDPRVAAIVFPSYDRTPFPIREASVSDMGRIDYDKGITYWNLNTRPLEPVKNPILVNALGAYGVFNTNALRTVRGFRTGGVSEYSMESDLGWRLRKKGFSLYYSPNIDQSSIHLKWGVEMDATISGIIDKMAPNLRRKIAEEEGVENLETLFDRAIGENTFREMIERANHEISGGCRTDEASWIYERVSNEFSQIVKHYPFDKKLMGAINYIIRTLDHARLDKISYRQGSFSEPCNRDGLDYSERRLATIKGIGAGLVRGVTRL